jgi:hypothetical protein
MNLGRIPRPDWETYRFTTLPRVLGEPVPGETLTGALSGAVWNAVGAIVFVEDLVIHFDRARAFNLIDIALSGDDTYTIEIMSPDGWRDIATFQGQTASDLRRQLVPLASLTPPVNDLRVRASGGDGQYSLGHLRLYHSQDGRILLD